MPKQSLASIAKSVRTAMKKHSPEILTGIGIAGMITTTVMAVKATPKALILLEEKKDELDTDRLEPKGLKNLADHIVTTAFEGEVEVTRLFKYGEDFFIGDIVQIANEYGNEGSAYISELVISNSEEGLSIYPTFKTISK